MLLMRSDKRETTFCAHTRAHRSYFRLGLYCTGKAVGYGPYGCSLYPYSITENATLYLREGRG